MSDQQWEFAHFFQVIRESRLGATVALAGFRRYRRHDAAGHPASNPATTVRTHDMNQRRRVAGVLAVVVAGAALLAAACGGGPHPPAPAASAGALTAQKLDVFAHCMRGHGLTDFYFSHISGNSSALNSPGSYFSIGYWAAPADTSSPRFQAAQKACQHLIPGPARNPARLQAMLRQGVRFAACMRAHGYPTYPDPAIRNGHFASFGPPGVDTSSPQFLAAQKACHG